MASLHLFKLGHTQVLISCIQTDFTGTSYLITSFSHVRTKPSGHGCVSNCAPKQWNSLPSDICHIQSSTAFKTALKTHLYKQYHNKWFQILSSYLPPFTPPPPPPLYPPSLFVTFLLCSSVCVCVCCVCVCMCMCMCVRACVGGCGVWEIQHCDYILISWGFNVHISVDLVKRSVLTLDGVTRCHKNDRYYCHKLDEKMWQWM